MKYFWKATKLYQDVCKEKDTMLGKLAVLERNKRTLIEDNDMLNKKHKEALKVGMVTTVKEYFTTSDNYTITDKTIFL